MESTILGLMLDTSVLVRAERSGLTVDELLEEVRTVEGEVEIAVSAIAIAEFVLSAFICVYPWLILFAPSW